MPLSRALCSRCANAVPQASRAVSRTAARRGYASLASIGDHDDQREHSSRPRRVVKKDRFHTSEAEDSSIDLFKSVVSESTRNRNVSTSRASEIEDICRDLDALLASEDDIVSRCGAFSSDLWPTIRSLGSPLPQPVFIRITRCVAQLSQRLAHERVDLSHKHLLMRLSDSLTEIGATNVMLQTGLILNLCLALGREEAMNSMARGDVLSVILRIWANTTSTRRRGLQEKRRTEKQNQPFSPPNTGTFAKYVASVNKAGVPENEPDINRDIRSITFAALLSHQSWVHAKRAIPSLLASLAVLVQNGNQNLLGRVAPLMRFLHQALKDTPVDDEYICRVFRTIDLGYHKEYTEELESMVRAAWPQVQAAIDQPDTASPTKTWQPTVSIVHARLKEAFGAGDKEGIMSTWRQLHATLAKSETLSTALQNDPAHLDFWCFVWCAIGRDDMLGPTQALMKQMGQRATVKTYTAMMHGWKIGKKYDSITLLWAKLQSTGMKLDRHIWTERISALIDIGKAQEGIAALGEMMATWKKNPETGVEPTTAVINGAVGSLIRKDKRAALRVLAWAGEHGIKPDVWTFNILLGQSNIEKEEVTRLLAEMRRAGIEPDEATFTIILADIAGSMDGASESEQVAGINSICSLVDESGLDLNHTMFAKILHVIASNPETSDEAVEAVLKNMADRGHNRLSPHMGLILLERLMASDTGANSEAISALLTRHGLSNISKGDQRLWEHVISSYAQVGDADGAMKVYKKLVNAGRYPRVFCLRDLLSVLLKESRLEEAAAVVDQTVENMQTTAGERNWRHGFFHMARQAGLLSNKDLPPELVKALAQWG